MKIDRLQTPILYEIGGDLKANKFIGSAELGTEFIASGTISTGDVVYLKSNGTVDVISPSGYTVNNSEQIKNGDSLNYSTIYDSTNNVIVITYVDSTNSNYGTAIVGTVNSNPLNSTITFGSPTTYTTSTTYQVEVVYVPTDNVFVFLYVYSGGRNKILSSKVGYLVGTDINFSLETQISATGAEYISLTYDSFNDVVVACYDDIGNSNIGKAVVGRVVTGNDIEFYLPVTFNNNTTVYISSIFDSINNKIVVAYGNGSSISNVGTVIVCEYVSIDDNVSFGVDYQFYIGTVKWISSVFDLLNEKVVLSFNGGGTGKSVVGTINGSNFSSSSDYEFYNGNVSYVSSVYDTTNNKVVISYTDVGNSNYGTYVVGTVSGTEILYDTPVVFNNDESLSYLSSTYDTLNNLVIINGSNSSRGLSTILSPLVSIENLSNIIGLSTENITSGSTGIITTNSYINSNQSLLQKGSSYSVDITGKFGLTDSISLNRISKKIGTAVNSTDLLVEIPIVGNNNKIIGDLVITDKLDVDGNTTLNGSLIFDNKTLTGVSTGVTDNDKLVTKGYVDNILFPRESLTATTSQTVFTFTNPIAGRPIFLNSGYAIENVDFTITNTNEITFNYALNEYDIVTGER